MLPTLGTSPYNNKKKCTILTKLVRHSLVIVEEVGADSKNTKVLVVLEEQLESGIRIRMK
jgi:hypothetical protein